MGRFFLFNNPVKDDGFGLVDIPHPYWALTIALPENKILSVLFTDRGLVKKDIAYKFRKKGGIKSFAQLNADEDTKLFSQIITFKLLLAQYNLANIPYGFRIKENGIQSQKVPSKRRYREKLKNHVLQDMANICGLGDGFGQAVYDRLPSNRKG